MSWGYGNNYNPANIPALSSYAEAKTHFESVAPIRGRANPECNKPLGKNRRYTWYRIMQRQTSKLIEGDPIGEYVTTYGAQLYGGGNGVVTPLTVEFHENGDLDINLEYACPTTKNFVSFVLAKLGRVESLSGKWYWINRHDNSQYPLRLMSRLGEYGLNRFRIDGNGLVPIDAKPEHRYAVNRKAMNAIRKRFKPFLDYAHNALSIHGLYDRIEVAEFSHGINFETQFTHSRWSNEEGRAKCVENRNNLFSAMEKASETGDLGMQYELLTLLACQAGRYSYREQRYICDKGEFSNFLTNLIKIHYRDTVMDKHEMPVGKAFFDRNGKYFK
jgi:hypothetical protein